MKSKTNNIKKCKYQEKVILLNLSTFLRILFGKFVWPVDSKTRDLTHVIVKLSRKKLINILSSMCFYTYG